jgi:hypothetical protein
MSGFRKYTLSGRQYPVPDLSTIYRLKFPLSTDIPAQVEQLSTQPEVVWTEANLIYRAHATPNDPGFTQQHYLHNTGQYRGWRMPVSTLLKPGDFNKRERFMKRGERVPARVADTRLDFINLF